MTPEEIIDSAIRTAEANRHKVWRGTICGLAESPIEALFLAAVYASNIDWGDNPVHIYTGKYAEDASLFDGDHLWPQTQIGNYRVDFLFEHVGPRCRRRVIVECDGHVWHDKTSELAAADKARDRFLAGRGFQVLRFTGSEICRDPIACWNETQSVLLGLAEAA